jgi:hypothetical protein
MFIRWNRKLLAQSNPLEPMRYLLSAVLVESHRENGKPRQRVLKYLASIQEDHLESREHRARFWETVEEQLSGFEAEDKIKLVKSINKKVVYTRSGELFE